MNALVTDAAIAAPFIGQREPRFGENTLRYYEACRDQDWCLTHTLVDPQNRPLKRTGGTKRS